MEFLLQPGRSGRLGDRLKAGFRGNWTHFRAVLSVMAPKSDPSLSWVVRQVVRRFVREHHAQQKSPMRLADQAGGKEASG